MGKVLERLVRRMDRHPRRSGLLRTLEDEAEADGEGDPEGNLAASAVSGQAPPAGPQWVSRLAPLEPQALAYDKPLCTSLDGFTLHAATRAGALDPAGLASSPFDKVAGGRGGWGSGFFESCLMIPELG